MGTCCLLTRTGFDPVKLWEAKNVFYLIASRPEGVLSWGGGSTVRTVKVWGPTLRGGEAQGNAKGASMKGF